MRGCLYKKPQNCFPEWSYRLHSSQKCISQSQLHNLLDPVQIKNVWFTVQKAGNTKLFSSAISLLTCHSGFYLLLMLLIINIKFTAISTLYYAVPTGLRYICGNFSLHCNVWTFQKRFWLGRECSLLASRFILFQDPSTVDRPLGQAAVM